MRHFFFSFCFLSFIGSYLCQNKAKEQKLKPGDRISETITWYKDSVTQDNYEFPNNAFTLVYRFTERDGTKDNFDSLHAVIKHIYRLNRYFGPRRKPSRLVCVIYVKNVDKNAIDLKNQINTWRARIGDSIVKTERAGFNFNRPFQTLFIKKDAALKPTSILNAGKVSVLEADGTLLWTSPIAGFRFNGKKGTVKGKLLTDKQGKKVPVSNAMVSMLKTGVEEPDSALTDAYGDFELGVPDENTEYSIIVRSHVKDVDNIILATQSGQEISKLAKTSRGFEYKLIPADVIRLTEMEVSDDISLTFSKFKAKQDNDLKVTENILYASGQYKIENDSKVILDKVVKIMKENPKVKLEVVSHTDAEGDDASNMLLSEKRSGSVIDYFVSKGVDAVRLKAIGKGETEIRNRCTNGIDCSDKEHEYNRRTEFKFTKG